MLETSVLGRVAEIPVSPETAVLDSMGRAKVDVVGRRSELRAHGGGLRERIVEVILRN